MIGSENLLYLSKAMWVLGFMMLLGILPVNGRLGEKVNLLAIAAGAVFITGLLLRFYIGIFAIGEGIGVGDLIVTGLPVFATVYGVITLVSLPFTNRKESRLEAFQIALWVFTSAMLAFLMLTIMDFLA